MNTRSTTQAGAPAILAGPIRWPRFAAVAVLLVIAPFLMGDFAVFQMTNTIIYAIAILGLVLLAGYSGQISLGHGAFFAIGAYVAAVAMEKLGIPYWATIPAAAVVCFLAGFLFGFPALRLEGHYLALATFALAIAIPQLLKHPALEGVTGGVQGIVVDRPEAPFELPGPGVYDLPLGLTLDFTMNSDRWLYFVALAIAALGFLLARNLIRGRVGRALMALRDHPVAARCMGIDTGRYKATVFGVSAAYTGIAGALSAVAVQFVAADSFTFFLSITLLVGAVVGGVESLRGAILGAIFVQFIPVVASGISVSAPWAIYGAFMLATIYLMPNGIDGLLKKLLPEPRQRLDK